MPFENQHVTKPRFEARRKENTTIAFHKAKPSIVFGKIRRREKANAPWGIYKRSTLRLSTPYAALKIVPCLSVRHPTFRHLIL